MTPLDRIEAAEKAATPGPWTADGPEMDRGKPWFHVWGGEGDLEATYLLEADAILIALLRNHAADLIAVARAARFIRSATKFLTPEQIAEADPMATAILDCACGDVRDLLAALALLTEDSE